MSWEKNIFFLWWCIGLCLLPHTSMGDIGPDWTKEAVLPKEGQRENIYDFPKSNFEELKAEGLVHAVRWPVQVTGLLVPYRPFSYFLEGDIRNPLRKFVSVLAKTMVNFKSRQELYSWLGLLNFPKDFDYSSGAFEGLYRQNSMGISGRSFGNDIWVRGLSFWSIFGEDYNWIKQ